MSKTVLVCAALTPLHLADNLAGRCADCGCGVQYRPHAPADARKLCFEYALPSLEENDTKLVTTRAWSRISPPTCQRSGIDDHGGARQIKGPNYTAGIVLSHDVVVETAPIVRWRSSTCKASPISRRCIPASTMRSTWGAARG